MFLWHEADYGSDRAPSNFDQSGGILLATLMLAICGSTTDS